jgi:two-component system nitrate/nitrite response regulator NarL
MLRRPGRDQVLQADSAARVVELCQTHSPALVLLETHMPGLDTFSAAADIRRLRPHAKIGLLTRHSDPQTLSRVRKHHLHGLIYKCDPTEELHYAIKRMLGGGFYTPPSATPSSLTPQVDDGLNSLTERENSVLALYAQGLSIKDIANELHISVKTAETHRNNFGRKLGIPTGALYFSRPPAPLPGRVFGWELLRFHTHRSKAISGHLLTGRSVRSNESMSRSFSKSLSRSSRAACERQVWAAFFGDLIRSARQTRRLSVEEASRAADMAASEWEAIEAGTVPRILKQLHALAAGLSLEFEAIVPLVLFCRDAWRR